MIILLIQRLMACLLIINTSFITFSINVWENDFLIVSSSIIWSHKGIPITKYRIEFKQ
jgi:hypothetical protein